MTDPLSNLPKEEELMAVVTAGMLFVGLAPEARARVLHYLTLKFIGADLVAAGELKLADDIHDQLVDAIRILRKGRAKGGDGAGSSHG